MKDLLIVVCLLLISEIQAFVPAPVRQAVAFSGRVGSEQVVLDAKKKKRKRKKAPGATDQVASPQVSPVPDLTGDVDVADVKKEEELSTEDLAVMKDIANFEFKPDDAVSSIGVKDEKVNDEGNPFQLPDIKDALRKREIEEELARLEEEERESQPKIKRSDTKAFKKLLESNPFADGDDAFFEEEEYGVVSALLGERAAPFLGIPTGPIQVGHFIGALAIMLMGFVEYPGFPLTNLPSPVRGCFQGGLATVYAINVVLAGLSFFKANERGQPALLWVAKSFAVGGLAFDQLTQLPTLDELKKAEKREGAGNKGKRR